MRSHIAFSCTASAWLKCCVVVAPPPPSVPPARSLYLSPSGCGVKFDSLAVEEAMLCVGIPAPLCDTACELVVDAYADDVDGSLLPSVLVRAGVPALGALRVYAALVKVCIITVFIPPLPVTVSLSHTEGAV